MGMQNRILRVDLTKGKATIEPLNTEWAERYVGSRGLGAKYLSEEVDPKVDPLSPKNKLIFAPGPLTGTMAPTGGRYTVVTKGALTGAITTSNSGGKWGAELKFAGYDLLIIEGKAKSPVYLVINDDDVQILPAKGLWGKTVWQTEPWIHAQQGNNQMKVASIGIAGEYGCKYACIVNDLHRAAGRSGVGTVMGSKNLKAIGVYGTRGVPSDNPKKFMAAVNKAKAALAASEDRQGLTSNGTNSMMNVVQSFGSLPTMNNRQVQFDGAAKISDEGMMETLPDGHTNLIKNAACFACTIACGRIAHIHPEHFSVKDRPEYQIASGGLEYETAYALGAMVGVDDIDAATFAGFMANEHGMDPISLGGSISAAMELVEEGIITTKDTGGIELTFGNAEVLCQISEMVGKGEGFGKIIGLGSKLMCEKYKHPEFSMTVKGQEFAGYDGRAQQGMDLCYATSNRGACHLRGDTFGPDFENTGTKGKAQAARESQDVITAMDSTGMCLFVGDAGMDLQLMVDMLDADLVGKWDMDRFTESGERTWNLERQFNLGAGLTMKDDTLPKRILEEPAPSGTAKGMVSGLPKMLPEYYELRGWSKDGKPTNSTLSRLNL